MCCTRYVDFISSGNYKGVVDLTPGEGGLAYACLLHNVPIFAVPFTQTHGEALYGHLVKRVFHAMVDPKSPSWLFEAPLVKMLASNTTKPSATTTNSSATTSNTKVFDGRPQLWP